MAEFTLLEFKGTESSRRTIYNATLSMAKCHATASLGRTTDRVTLIEVDGTQWTRYKGDKAWTRKPQ